MSGRRRRSHVLLRPTLLTRLAVAVVRAVFGTIAHVRVEGGEHLPSEGPLIVIGNHTSFADPPLVGGWLQPRLGRPVHFLAKEQIFTPLLAPFLERIGAIPVRAGGSDVDAYRQGRAVLDAGGVLAIFPEGTRSPDGALIEPRQGVALLASRSGVPVLPVGIAGAHAFWPRGRRLPLFGRRITLRIGEPFLVGLDQSLVRRAAIAAATDDLMRRLARLLPGEQRGRFG